jgi:hypothetical protein
LALILVFSLSACGGSSTQKPITDDESTQTSTADQSTTQESESTAETTAVTMRIPSCWIRMG